MGRACSTNVEERNAYRMSVGKPEEKRPLGRPRHSSEDNIEMDIRDRMDRTDLAKDRDKWKAIVNIVMNIRVP
jgi:hypothetical protein